MEISCEWAGSLTGLVGAGLLALNDSVISGWGFVAFFLSNRFWITVGVRRWMPGRLLMQVGFTGTSVLGLSRWLF